MNMVRCPYGHVYDQDQYQICPICAQNNRFNASPDFGNQAQPFSNSVTSPGSVPGTRIVNGGQSPYFDPNQYQNNNYQNQGFQGFQQPFYQQPPIFPYGGNAQSNVYPMQNNQPQAQIPMNSENGKTKIYYNKSFSTEPVAGWLVCVLGNDKGKCFVISAGKTSIGRSDTKKYKINLSDEKISRANPIGTITYISIQHQFYFIAEPTGNLTPYVNGNPVLMQILLNDYDELRIGSTVLLFRAFCSEQNNWENSER